MRRPQWAILALLILPFAPAAARGDITFSLFDGKSLSGWTNVHDAKFSVRDGILSMDGGMGWLRTDHRSRDFVLVIEWRALADGHDSGIFFRAPLEGKPWPRGYQVNLQHSQIGKLVGVEGAGGATPPCIKPRGEWNRFELSVVEKRGSLKANGVEVWKTEALEEREGFIGLQAEEHKFEFRAISLTEVAYTDLTEGLAAGTGKHLVARGQGNWAVRADGALVNSGAGGGWIGTVKPEWGDFSLKLDYRIPRDGNSGVFIRHPLEGNPAYEGLEIQIVDDDTRRWALNENQLSGSIYAAVGRSRRATRAAGTWESMEITARGPKVTVHMNGFPVVDANLDDLTAKIEEAKPLKDRPRRGYIGLQSYGTGAEFRNLRVKKLEG